MDREDKIVIMLMAALTGTLAFLGWVAHELYFVLGLPFWG